MKNIIKKFTSIWILFVLLFSFIKIVNAFEYMDICNYTNWDTSGDYYDRYCNNKGAPSENEYEYLKKLKEAQEKSKKNEYIKKGETTHILNKVNHRTWSSISFGKNNTKINNEIKLLKKTIKDKNILLEKFIKINKSLVNSNNNKNLLIKKITKQNTILKYYLKNSSKLKKDTKIFKTTKKSPSEIIRERIKKRNSLLK